MPRAASFFIVAALTGIGVPCLASFWAELMVFIAAFKVYPFYGTLAVGALVISALFILRVVQQTCYGPVNQRLAHLPDITPLGSIPRVILVSVIVFFGFFPALMVNLIQTATVAFFNGLP